MKNKALSNQLIACKRCDALAIKPRLIENQLAKCGQCGTTLFSRKKDSINRTFAVSFAGLLLLFPAIFTPLLGVEVLGYYNQVSLINCISIMIDKGAYFVAASVFVFAVAIPTIRLVAAFYLSFCLKYNYRKTRLLVFFRSYHQLDSWTMLHVFFLGVIVSMYKLVQMTNMSVDYGLAALILVLLCSTLLSVILDQDQVWESLEFSFVSKNG